MLRRAKAGRTRSCANKKYREQLRPSRQLVPYSRQITTQNKRGRGIVIGVLIVARAAADLAKSGARVKPASRFVVLVDFEEHGLRAEAGEPPQMQIEQRSGQAAAALCRRHGNRQDFRFARRNPRQDESLDRAALGCTMRDDVALDQQPLELAVAPAAAERSGMQSGDGAGVAR